MEHPTFRKGLVAPKPACPAPNPGAGDSAVRDEPTEEELLEDQTDLVHPPALAQLPGPAFLSPTPPAAVRGAVEGQLPSPAFLPSTLHSNSAELLPKSWQAALSAEQQQWISRVLFTRDSSGRSRLISDLNLWWSPPQTRPVYSQPPASPDLFFACRLFLWMPHQIWHQQLTCPQPLCTGSMTKAGLYRTIRRVLDIDGWYLMATEYLECRRCKKKVGGWSQGIIRQLAPQYSCQFPAVLTYKLSCDLRVVVQLRSRTLGNSASRLYNTLREQHSETWMRRAIQYLGVCEQFLALYSARGQTPPPPPEMPPVPKPVWLMTVFTYDVLSRLDEYKARITSTFGSILKMDSTKKVTKKLAGAASDTATCVTNVGNEHGQVLMSVLTCSEGAGGLSRMATGLMRRYRLAGVPPPQLMYVDRDCCDRDGVSKTADLFQEWEQLVVRLSICQLMRRFASGVTTEAHELYPTFMGQLSRCIFEVDPEDARRLTEAKRSELEEKRGMVGLTDAEVIEEISKREWRLHCRRRTRGAEVSTLLIQDLLDTFGGPAGRNSLDIPLLDALCMQDIWSTQRPHISCIQDPPGVQLYTQTGRLTKGGVILPVYRCARGSTSLESFHLHLNRFIPGTRASGIHFQAFLVDGLVRWNEDRATAASPPPVAAEGKVGRLHSYSGHLKHVLNQKSQRVLGRQLVKDFTKPAEYTGELIGVEYLYQQTGKVLEDVSLDPDTSDEAAAAIESLAEEEDEGICEDVEDPTIFQTDTPSTSVAAARSGDPADVPSEPSGPAAPDASPEAPEVPQQPSSDSEENIQVPDGQPGYQHVLKLAQALVEGRNLQGLPDSRVDRLILLWNRLREQDKQRVVYPPRYQERQPKGRFKAPKGKNTTSQRCFLGLNSGPANWPIASRLVEAICSQLCQLHPAATKIRGVTRTRWALVLADYVAIQGAVLHNPRLMAQTELQLFELKQRTLIQWFARRQMGKGKTVLSQGTDVGVVPAGAVAAEPLPSAKGLSYVQVGQGQPFLVPPDEQPGPSSGGLAHPPPPPPLAPAGQPPLPGPSIPRTTAFRKRKAAEAAAAGQGPQPRAKTRRPTTQFTCSKCGRPKRLETGHTHLYGVHYCAAVGGKTVEEWKEEMREKHKGGP